MSIDGDILHALALEIAALPLRPPMTTDQALERVIATSHDDGIRELARCKLEELRGRR